MKNLNFSADRAMVTTKLTENFWIIIWLLSEIKAPIFVQLTGEIYDPQTSSN